jgi:hypothetical protein
MATFDVFKRLSDGKPLWITAASTRDEARKRINRLGTIAPGEYLIYSQKQGLIIESVTN